MNFRIWVSELKALDPRPIIMHTDAKIVKRELLSPAGMFPFRSKLLN